jgi:uncharacterized protein (TIGR02466 family)
MTKYWVNVDADNSYGLSHCHYNSLLSGVFYIQVPAGSGSIVFERPDHQEHCFKSDLVTPYTTQSFEIKPTENMLLLFPSFIKHRINLHQFNNTGDERISISFDYQYSTVI